MNSEVRHSAESRRVVKVPEDGVGIGAEIGPERVFLDGPGRCFRNYGPRTAVGSVGQGLLTRKHPASSMLTALGPHVRTILTPNSVLLVLCLDHLPAASAKDDEEPRCKPMLSEILITSWYEHEAARTQA